MKVDLSLGFRASNSLLLGRSALRQRVLIVLVTRAGSVETLRHRSLIRHYLDVAVGAAFLFLLAYSGVPYEVEIQTKNPASRTAAGIVTFRVLIVDVSPSMSHLLEDR